MIWLISPQFLVCLPGWRGWCSAILTILFWNNDSYHNMHYPFSNCKDQPIGFFETSFLSSCHIRNEHLYQNFKDFFFWLGVPEENGHSGLVIFTCFWSIWCPAYSWPFTYSKTKEVFNKLNGIKITCIRQSARRCIWRKT